MLGSLFKQPEYKIKTIGRGVYDYIKGDHVLCVDGDMTVDGVMIYTGAGDRWNPPYQDEIISESERKLILQRVRKYLSFWGGSGIKFVDRFTGNEIAIDDL